MWMIRAGRGGQAADYFLEEGRVAIGWGAASRLPLGVEKPQVLELLGELRPDLNPTRRNVAASQITRFLSEIQVGDRVCTWDPALRRFCLGLVLDGDGTTEHSLGRYRKVRWNGQVAKQRLSKEARQKLGAIQTLFMVHPIAERELEDLAQPLDAELEQTPAASAPEAESSTELDEGDLPNDANDAYERSVQLIDDALVRLDWGQMQDLVAGVLVAMGYRCEVAEPGPDRGVDIFASPDGLGLQEPRIFVEVKHRPGTSMGSPALRSFLGGRQPGDRCLYVSTGGFTKEARYEAERSNVPLSLIDLPRLRELVLEHYENFDPAVAALLPLRRIYWPV